MFITSTATSIRVRRGSGSTPTSSRHRERLVALPVRHGAKASARRGQQVVQVRGAGAGQPGDDHRRQQFDVVDLRVATQQVGQQQPVLEPLQQLRVEVDDSGVMQAVDLAQRGEVDVEALAVVVGAEVVRPVSALALACSTSASSGHSAPSRPSSRRICSASGAEPGRGEVVEAERSSGRSRRLMLL